MKKFISILCVILVAATACSRKEQQQHERFDIKTEAELQDCLEMSKGNPFDRELNYAIWRYYTAMDMADELFVHAKPIYRLALRNGDNELFAHAGAYIGQMYFYLDNKDSMLYYLNSIKDISEQEQLTFPLIAYYNNMAMYEATYNVDYAQALEYMHSSISIMERSGDKRNYVNTLCNLSSIYYERQDTTGLKYAMTAYNESEKENFYTKFISALLVSRFYILRNVPEAGLPFIEEAVNTVESHTEMEHSYRILVYSVYAEILKETGDIQKSEKYYKKAIALVNCNTTSSYSIMAYSGYGQLLIQMGRYNEALETFMKANESSAKSGFHTDAMAGIYYHLSEIYRLKNDSDNAFMYYKKYISQRDSLYTLESERQFNLLAMRYDNIRHEKEIQQNQLKMAQSQKRNYVITSILALALVTISGMYYYNHKKNILYRKLVEKDQEALKKACPPKAVEIELTQEESKAGPIPEGKANELYMKIEQMMKENHLYRQNDLTLVSISELLQTNRWYISRVINEYSGKSFNNYINEFRINEAISILSDPENDTPLKTLSDNIGFNSISVFYKYFQQKTGVPPSKYRAEVKRIAGKQ